MEKYLLVDRFAGYRNKEDITNMPPGVMVEGSQNVLTNDGERVAVREGYTLDGQANSATTPIISSYDWLRHQGDVRHVRSYQDELVYRYVDASGNVTWRRLANGWGSEVDFNWAEFWDADELIDRLLFVNGSSNIYDWSGGITTLASATMTTLTNQGVSWAEGGFYTNTSNMQVVMNGVTYTYTSVNGDTIYGVTPDPLLSVIDQSQTTQNASTPVGEADSTGEQNKVGQSFIPTASTLAGVRLYKAGDAGSFTGDVIIEIYDDFTGEPAGPALASATIPNADWLDKPTGLFGVTFTPIAVIPANIYWIVIRTTTSDTANCISLGINNAGGYASGELKSFNITDGWVVLPGNDLVFATVTSFTTPTVGEVIHQAVHVTPNSAITDLPDDFANDLIRSLYNQVYIGSFVDRTAYISKQNDFTDFSFSSPRTPGEGALITLDATPVGFIPQEDSMYITAGNDLWYQTLFTLSSDLQSEALNITRLKTGVQQAAQSQALITKNKNDVVFVTNEPTVTTLGRLELIEKPQIKDISDPIKLDMQSYDFTGGSAIYFQDNLYIAVPRNGVVRIFNISKGWWEAPQILPISRFAIIDGELYGHSSVTPETYKIFDGVNDNGAPIAAQANFSYQHFGDRANLKNFYQYYVEGYISSNTSLTCRLVYDYHGATDTRDLAINGNDRTILFDSTSDGSLGKQSLGKKSLAGRSDTVSTLLPPKFRVRKEVTLKDFYELQVQFISNGDDQHWELLSWGPNAQMSPNLGTNINQ